MRDRLPIVVVFVLSGLGVSGGHVSEACARGRPTAMTASTPAEAVERLARSLFGDEVPVDVAAQAFEGLPEPGPRVRFRARGGGLDPSGFRLSVTVEALAGDRLLARRTYVFPCRLEEPVVVPRRVIRAGTTIRQDDLEVKTMPVDGSFERYALSLEGLVGRVARRTLLPGRPVPARMLERPAAVLRGAPVKVRILIGQMAVSMDGEALEDAAVGETVKVLNPSSKRVLSGRVIDHGLVEVM